MKAEVQKKLEILQSLYKADLLYPFPSDDCQKLLAENGVEFEALIPSLDIYFSDVAGLCSWGKRSFKWTDEFISEFKPTLQKSFFQRFPLFAPLESSINESNTPKLFNHLLIYDLMRLTLLDILPDIIEARNARSKKLAELSLAS